MKVQFCGAARTVTGSCHLLKLDNGLRILFDCGLYQGNDPDFDDFNHEWGFEPESIDLVLLSHSHIDHAGRIPRLVKDGFKGKVYCTHASRSLAEIMLLDSAHIQEKDAEWLNRKRRLKGNDQIKPLYTIEDARAALNHFIGVPYDTWIPIAEGIEAFYADAGHILGSSSITLKVEVGGGYHKYIGFSGDIGRPDRPILKDPTPIMACDYLICESTYGGQDHQGVPEDKHDLLEIIRHTCIDKGGKLIVPAFSVGRTQELIYMLDQLENERKLPRIPVYIDSPLAVDATEVFKRHEECFDDTILNYMKSDPHPFGFGKLHYTKQVEQSKAINAQSGPMIIISASGMMQAGRIKHHLHHSIEDDRNTILVVGFCAEGTLGRLIRDGAQYVNIFGDRMKVNAEVRVMDSFSAHGDEDEMIQFLRLQDKKRLKKIFLVHGEVDRQHEFRMSLLDRGFRKVEIPSLYQTYNL